MVVACSQLAFAQTDREALIAFYEATNGENWVAQEGWKEEPLLGDGFNDDPSSEPFWVGISCEDDRVTRLTVRSNNNLSATPLR